MPDERITKIEQSLKDIEYRLNTHKHSGADLTQKIPQRRYFSLRLVTSATNTAVANVVGGDFSVPFSGYVESIEATVDTAGTSNDPKLVVTYTVAAGPANVKTWDGITQSTGIKTYMGVALASTKTYDGIA